MNRDGMLNAAEEVVLRDGIGRLTLDAVAKEADLSKGGLMHHFPTKDALIDAMVRRKVDAWRAEYEAAIARQASGPGRVSTARCWCGSWCRSSRSGPAASASAARTSDERPSLRFIGQISTGTLPP